ncbi:histone deacetylase [Achlya hypogyna]|uniref:histone deacetylase n=1 Tax=Achlya hypogyna TaxID=1202772 RepID=A0A1V9YMR5_ACHHY|nr:histone deacetylase [Achlya hypogyna]
MALGLHKACTALDEAAVRESLVAEDLNVDAFSAEGFTAIGLLALTPPKQHELAAQLAAVILAAGASLQRADPLGYAPLHVAAQLGNLNLLSLFTDHGADINARNARTGETPLHCAARFGQHHAIQCALSASEVDIAMRAATQCYMATREPSMRTLLLHHSDCMEHVTEHGHQESPDRIAAVLTAIDAHPSLNAPRVVLSSAFPMASFAAIRRVHADKYIDTLKNLHDQVPPAQSHGLMVLTPRIQVEVQGALLEQAKTAETCDTNFSRGTLRAALRAAGSVMHAIDRVVTRDARNAFCIVRPPGHHAGVAGLLRDAVSCGFCILNNVMVGAQHALDTYPGIVARVAIVDFDAHHGNGTEDILQQRRAHRGAATADDILFVSLHCFGDGFYPGSGQQHDLSTNVFNVALPPCWRADAAAADKGVHAFRRDLARVVVPLLRAFKPDLVLISAGFDGCKGDIGNKQHGNRDGPMGLDLRPDDFYWATTQLVRVANACCDGRVVSVLEGGYGRKEKRAGKTLVLDTLQESAIAHIRALAGDHVVVAEPELPVASPARRPQRQCPSTYKRTNSDSSPVAVADTPPTARRRNK